MLHVRNGPHFRKTAEFLVRPPAIILTDPKYAHNVGQVVRLACCFGIDTVMYSGDRVQLDNSLERLPREERMRDYADVSLVRNDRPFDSLVDAVPVAIELTASSESLPAFVHPPNAVYVFGPEDGSLGRLSLQHCHRFVSIPTRHCLNLATAVSVVLYDRLMKAASS